MKLIENTKVRSLGIKSLKWKLLPNLVLFLTLFAFKTIKHVFYDLFNLVQGCKNIEPWDRKTRIRDFFSTVRVVSLTTCMLFKYLLNSLFIAFSGSFYKRVCKQYQTYSKWQKALKMCINSTKGSSNVGRSGKCLIFTKNLYIKKGHFIYFSFSFGNHVLAC